MSQEQRRPDAGPRAEVQPVVLRPLFLQRAPSTFQNLPPWPHSSQSEGAQLLVKRLPASQGCKPACLTCPHTFNSWMLKSPFLHR